VTRIFLNMSFLLFMIVSFCHDCLRKEVVGECYRLVEVLFHYVVVKCNTQVPEWGGKNGTHTIFMG